MNQSDIDCQRPMSDLASLSGQLTNNHMTMLHTHACYIRITHPQDTHSYKAKAVILLHHPVLT